MKKSLGLILALLLGLGFWFWKRSASEPLRTLRLFIWSDYIDPSVYADFYKEYGIQVIEDNYASNEELEAKLKAGAEGYDILVPSDYMVKRLIAGGFLAPLPKAKIPNLRYVAENFRHPNYDPTETYSVPYMWGTTGIAYNAKKFEVPPDSWAQFFDPNYLKKLDKRVSLLDDVREAMGAALLKNGASLNSHRSEDIAAAKKTLADALPYFGRIDGTSYKDLLASGDLWMAHAFSGDIHRAAVQNPDLRYVIPKEGAPIYTDNLVIPLSATDSEAAALFIDFVMRPEVNARIARFIHYTSTHALAQSFVAPEEQADPSYFPTAEVLKRLHWYDDLEDLAEVYDQAWSELKASSFSM